MLVKRFVGKETKRNKYALVKLYFMKKRNLSDDLQVEANVIGLIAEPVVIRKYFGIEYHENLGDIIRQFTKYLGRCIPEKMPYTISDLEKSVMIRSLSQSDSEDINKIYCTKIRRNPTGSQRTDFNSDKTRLLRPSLFERFCNDKSISFCYSINASEEKDDATIIYNFSK